MTCDHVALRCGCASWLEFESGTWVRKYWRCLYHCGQR